MYKAVFGRTTKMPCGCVAGKELGINTWAAFYGTDENAYVDGDFAVVAGELQGVLKSLRGKGENPIGVSNLTSHEWVVLAIGFVVSFIVAYGSVAWFMAWVRRQRNCPRSW